MNAKICKKNVEKINVESKMRDYARNLIHLQIEKVNYSKVNITMELKTIETKNNFARTLKGPTKRDGSSRWTEVNGVSLSFIEAYMR